MTRAAYVVAIGAKSPLLDEVPEALQRWDDIPAASVDYKAARDAVRARITTRITTLFDTMARHGTPE